MLSNLRQHRGAAGLSQSELALRVGVSRQALGAIEAGRQIPSTTLALRLARALRCTVDELFRLPGGPVVHAHLARAPGETRRVVVGQINDRWVAHPAHDDTLAADGVVLGTPHDGDLAAVELFGDPSQLQDNILVAGCAPLLGVLAHRIGRRYRTAAATWIPANSARALALLEEGLVHIAGIHLAGASEPHPHVCAARRIFPQQTTAVVNLARWRQGLSVAPGNPLGIEIGPGLLRPGLRHAIREVGAGAHTVLERMLRDATGQTPASLGHVRVALNHRDVARFVRWGVADAGVTIEAMALVEGLDFLPICEERFDLLLAQSRLCAPAIAQLIDQIGQPAFRSEATRMRGYDLSYAGDISTAVPEVG